MSTPPSHPQKGLTAIIKIAVGIEILNIMASMTGAIQSGLLQAAHVILFLLTVLLLLIYTYTGGKAPPSTREIASPAPSQPITPPKVTEATSLPIDKIGITSNIFPMKKITAYRGFASVVELIQDVEYALRGKVSPNSYGIEWLLYTCDGTAIKLRNVPLAEEGIHGGSILEAKLFT